MNNMLFPIMKKIAEANNKKDKDAFYIPKEMMLHILNFARIKYPNHKFFFVHDEPFDTLHYVGDIPNDELFTDHLIDEIYDFLESKYTEKEISEHLMSFSIINDRLFEYAKYNQDFLVRNIEW